MPTNHSTFTFLLTPASDCSRKRQCGRYRAHFYSHTSSTRRSFEPLSETNGINTGGRPPFVSWRRNSKFELDSTSTDSSTEGRTPEFLEIDVYVLTWITQGIYTILRDESANRQDFIFFVDRLATFLMEKAMEQLPYCSKTITTPVDVTTTGMELDAKVGY